MLVPGLSPAADLLQSQRSHSWPQQMPIHCRGSFPRAILLGTSSVRIQAGTAPWGHVYGIQEVGWGRRTTSFWVGHQDSWAHSCKQLPSSWARRTEAGQCHSPYMAGSCGSQQHRELLLSAKNRVQPPAPQGSAPSARWFAAATQPGCRCLARAQQALGQEGATRTAPFLASISVWISSHRYSLQVYSGSAPLQWNLQPALLPAPLQACTCRKEPHWQ